MWASEEEKESVEKIDVRFLVDFGADVVKDGVDGGAGGAEMKDAMRVETRMACLRRNLSGRVAGRKLMMASNARSWGGRKDDDDDVGGAPRCLRVGEDEDDAEEEVEEREEVADGAGEGYRGTTSCTCRALEGSTAGE
jgi:hypothetical protein